MSVHNTEWRLKVWVFVRFGLWLLYGEMHRRLQTSESDWCEMTLDKKLILDIILTIIMNTLKLKEYIENEIGKEVEIAWSSDLLYIIYDSEVICTAYRTSQQRDYTINQQTIEMINRTIERVDINKKLLNKYYNITGFHKKIMFKFKYWYYVTRKNNGRSTQIHP